MKMLGIYSSVLEWVLVFTFQYHKKQRKNKTPNIHTVNLSCDMASSRIAYENLSCNWEVTVELFTVQRLLRVSYAPLNFGPAIYHHCTFRDILTFLSMYPYLQSESKIIKWIKSFTQCFLVIYIDGDGSSCSFYGLGIGWVTFWFTG